MKLKRIGSIFFIIAIITSFLSINCFAGEKLQDEKNTDKMLVFDATFKKEELKNVNVEESIRIDGRLYVLQKQKVLSKNNKEVILRVYYKKASLKQEKEERRKIILCTGIMMIFFCGLVIFTHQITETYKKRKKKGVRRY